MGITFASEKGWLKESKDKNKTFKTKKKEKKTTIKRQKELVVQNKDRPIHVLCRLPAGEAASLRYFDRIEYDCVFSFVGMLVRWFFVFVGCSLVR